MPAADFAHRPALIAAQFVSNAIEHRARVGPPGGHDVGEREWSALERSAELDFLLQGGARVVQPTRVVPLDLWIVLIFVALQHRHSPVGTRAWTSATHVVQALPVGRQK